MTINSFEQARALPAFFPEGISDAVAEYANNFVAEAEGHAWFNNGDEPPEFDVNSTIGGISLGAVRGAWLVDAIFGEYRAADMLPPCEDNIFYEAMKLSDMSNASFPVTVEFAKVCQRALRTCDDMHIGLNNHPRTPLLMPPSWSDWHTDIHAGSPTAVIADGGGETRFRKLGGLKTSNEGISFFDGRLLEHRSQSSIGGRARRSVAIARIR